MNRFQLLAVLATLIATNGVSLTQKKDPPGTVPADALKREKIKPKDLAIAGDGNPDKAPPELVGVQASLGPKKGYSCATFTLDGKYLILGSEDGRIVVWDLARDKATTTQGQNSKIWSVQVSPNRKDFVTASQDGKIVVRAND